MSKPSVFVGSSSEGLDVANKLQLLLAHQAEVTVWSQGVFGLGAGTLETLVEAAPHFDFAVLVLRPDDLVVARGEEREAPRDNVLFELGLFMGSLGRSRSFVLASDGPKLKLPSDLAGITIARYPEVRPDGNLLAALGPGATQILDQVRSLGRRNPECFSFKLRNSELRILKGNLLDSVHRDHAILLPANVYLDTTSEDGVVDPRSTLGKRLAALTSADLYVQFDADLDREITNCSLPKDSGQAALTKPGRQTPYRPGSTVYVETEQGPIVLAALTRLDRCGSRFISTLSEEDLAAALRTMWKGVAAGPIRSDLYMPIVGSGFGGITRLTALAHLLLSYRAADEQARVRLCPVLNVIVYDGDWGDGKWVRHLAEGLMA